MKGTEDVCNQSWLYITLILLNSCFNKTQDSNSL